MSIRLRNTCLAIALTLAGPAVLAQGIEFRSVSEAAILFDTPSDQGKRLFIVSPGTPVEVVVNLDKWVKVRDSGGSLTWIERDKLGSQRTLIVTAPSAVVRQRPESEAPVVFEATRAVVLELATPPVAGWVQVRHRDGAAGFLRISEVWGL
ncbi:MAG TPA: SH3 domain-containing protein [Rhodocyclaceae bacterium]|jgi:SH3-like domain-containing protein|nr:SH3 domain-containing protein [Rhodocyclaceae bacterium]HRQ46864.1 SH3 domain-containing protein [Rhodocyclaceae bacterium]